MERETLFATEGNTQSSCGCDDIAFIFEPRPPMVKGTALPDPEAVREYLAWLDDAAACRLYAENEAGRLLCG